LHITTIHRSGFLPAPIRMTLNDLECPIELKVRMSHGLLADSDDTSLASLLYSCKTDAVLTELSVSEPRKTCVADALSLCGS